MNVIIHGAINSSNFGDVLFAYIFYNKLRVYNSKINVYFYESKKYGVSDFIRKELNYYKKYDKLRTLDPDLLVYMSGGYFGEKEKKIKKQLKRVLRYTPIGLYYVIKRKSLIISGIGGGPLYNCFCRNIMKIVARKADIITVRDQETLDYFNKHSFNKNIVKTTDTALLLRDFNLDQRTTSLEELGLNNSHLNKSIFLHIINEKNTYMESYVNSVIQGLNMFLLNNPDFILLVSYDQESNINVKDNAIWKSLKTKNKYCLNYNGPLDLCKILSKVSLVITPKLHVGIVAATYSKSVLSFPIHYEKTKRFYHQINESARCVAIEDATAHQVHNLLKKYHNKRIAIPDQLLSLADKNINIITEKIDELFARQKEGRKRNQD